VLGPELCATLIPLAALLEIVERETVAQVPLLTAVPLPFFVTLVRETKRFIVPATSMLGGVGRAARMKAAGQTATISDQTARGHNRTAEAFLHSSHSITLFVGCYA